MHVPGKIIFGGGINILNYKYLRYFPKPFLDDLINGHCIPFIGAGFSKNAELPLGKKMLGWDELGREFAEALPDYQYEYIGPLDAISAFSHEYKMAKLIEKLNELLFVNVAKPSSVYEAFCKLPFNFICTTNLEFLIERGYESIHKYCCPIVEEHHLAIARNSREVCLLKIHGDLHHVNRIVVTEEAYDGFIENYPLLATFLGNLFIFKTILFIGYSLDDPDIRQIWHIIGKRLGKLCRLAYAISVNASVHCISKFERRGVKVINLPGKKEDSSIIFETVFNELGDYWSKMLIQNSTITGEESMAEFLLPTETENRLCFISVPYRLLSFYKSKVFPIIEEFGFIPITAEGILTPGDNYVAKISAIMDRSKIILADITSQMTISEVGIFLSKGFKDRKILIIREENTLVPIDLVGFTMIVRPVQPHVEDNGFIESIAEWFKNLSVELRQIFKNEPNRLLDIGEYGAAVVAAFTLLEKQLRIYFEQHQRDCRFGSLRMLLEKAFEAGLIHKELFFQLRDWWGIRNKVIHLSDTISAEVANRIVGGVYEVIENIQVG